MVAEAECEAEPRVEGDAAGLIDREPVPHGLAELDAVGELEGETAAEAEGADDAEGDPVGDGDFSLSYVKRFQDW
jgi:hypothetical protein